MKMQIPPPLIQGDTIGIAAPAGCVDRSLLEKGIGVIEQMGFRVYIPDAVYYKKRYFAGPDHRRAESINMLFAREDIKAIVCARGGYGCTRILEFLNYDLISANPKIFVGFSDISALLCALNRRCGLVTLHGPVITTLSDSGERSKISLYSALTGSTGSKITIKGRRTIRQGRVQGRLVGGNLATLCHMIGTPFEPDFTRAILFFEDVGEPPYKIDRMLTQMKSAGMFDELVGVILGSFENCGDPEDIFAIVEDIFDDNIPIVGGVHAGHGRENFTIPLGPDAIMDTDKCELVIVS